MTNEEIICYECDEVITEPICEECFEREVVKWISEKRDRPKLNTEKIDSVLNLVGSTVQNVRLLPESSFFCILCFNKMHNICAYCLMKQTYNTISPYVQKDEMMLVFNYKIHEFGVQGE